MKILHSIRSLIINSGVTTFVSEIASAQAKLGHNVTVWCWWRPETPIPGAKIIVTKDLPINCEFDVVHIHAFWDLYQLRVIRWCHKHKVPYIFSPHGGLMPRVFTKGRIKKFIFWNFLMKPFVKQASMVHCTSEAEVEACKQIGLKGPFAILPLGVHIPQLTDYNNRFKKNNKRVVLFLGRISEEKGLINLLEAWHHLNSKKTYNEWILKLVGPDWHGYQKILKNKIISENITGIEFTGTADAKMKDILYRTADIFVLPSPMENFAVVVLDALAYGIPAIATKGTPWKELESSHCGLWIDQGVDALTEALEQLMSMSDSERYSLGHNGRTLAASKYQWRNIADDMIDAYEKNLKNNV